MGVTEATAREQLGVNGNESAADAAKNGIISAISKIGDYLLKYVGLFFMTLGLLILWAANAFLYVTAQVLEGSFSVLVRGMGDPARFGALWEAVKLGWAAIRDIGNTLFIFVLLYAAFNTVLGRKDGLDLVPRILIVALLVNFSYLFSTSIIDVSNTMADKVYSSLVGPEDTEGFSGQLATLAGYQNLNAAFSLEPLNQLGGQLSEAQKNVSATIGFKNFIQAVFTAAFIFILGGFMLAIAFTLIARFVTLVVLVVVSSLAFLAYLLPRFEGQSREWWTALIGQSFYAPAVFLMLLVTTGIAEKFQVGAPSNGTDGKLQEIFSFGLGQFFQFCILLGLLYASMKLARSLSEQGSRAALSIGSSAQKFAATAAFGGSGFALRNSLGILGGKLADSENVKKWSVQDGIRGSIGRRLLGVGGRLNESSFDFRKTGAAAALAAGTGADYGKVSDTASKGYKGAVEARDKAIQSRIDAARKMDLSGDEKKEKIDQLAADAAKKGSTPLGAAETTYRKAEKYLEQAKKSGFAGAITLAEQKLKAAKDNRDNLGYEELNKKVFGVSGSSRRDHNFSERYSRAMIVNAQRRANLARIAGIGLGGGAGTIGLGALVAGAAPVAGVAAAVTGTLSAGRAVANTVHRVSGRAGAEQRIAREYQKKFDENEKNNARIKELENKTSLQNNEKEELNRLRKKVEKFVNAG